MDNRFTVAALEILERQGVTGNGLLKQALEAYGYTVGEATAGRLLRQLDVMALTRRVGRQGRELTDAGRHTLKTLRGQQQRQTLVERLASKLDPATAAEAVAALEARRALERETAYLAAQRATSRELATIEQVFAKHIREYDTEGAWAVDASFHQAIAAASHNTLLAQFVSLVRENTYVWQMVTSVRKELYGSMSAEHAAVFHQIKLREPDGASRAMAGHIDHLIQDVRTYSQSAEDQREA